MAVKFTKGTEVKLNAVTPCGPVIDFRMDSDGEVWYLIEWPDAEGVKQQRWFAESVLTRVE